MAIVNRDLDPTQQTETIFRSLAATATGVTSVIALVESPSQAVACSIKAFGLSGSPVYSLSVLRVNAGGATTLGLGATLTALSAGTTGAQGFSITLGATVLLQAGDLVLLNSGVANTAATDIHLALVLKALQDVKSVFGTVVS